MCLAGTLCYSYSPDRHLFLIHRFSIQTKPSNVQNLNLSLSHPSRCVNGLLRYPSLPLVLPSHQPLPLFTIPHTRMLHRCIHPPPRTNQHWFHHLTPLSYSSACHSPPLTHTLRETHRPCTQHHTTPHHTTPFSHAHMTSFSHMHIYGEAEVRQSGTWSPNEGTTQGGSAMHTAVPKHTVLDSQAGRSWLHAARQSAWCSSPQARLQSAQDRRLG